MMELADGMNSGKTIFLCKRNDAIVRKLPALIARRGCFTMTTPGCISLQFDDSINRGKFRARPETGQTARDENESYSFRLLLNIQQKIAAAPYFAEGD
jgi:hypothetical protein